MSYPPSSLNQVSEREVLVRARGLAKRFGDFTAVDGIDFDLYRGEAFGFLGPNGAGKSSTMRMIGCVSPPTAGTLTILGLDPLADGAAILARRAAGAGGAAAGVRPARGARAQQGRAALGRLEAQAHDRPRADQRAGRP